MSENKYQSDDNHAIKKNMLSLYKAWLILLRPQQWIKNGFIWVGIIFGHAWSMPNVIYQASWITLAFIGISSSVYIINDWHDCEYDKSHPEKCMRPLATGQIASTVALCVSILLASLSLLLAYTINWQVGLIISLYFIINCLYSAGLKHVVILDVFIIASGFMLRILAGTWAIDIPPSGWLLICGGWLVLFLGFAKRRVEFTQTPLTCRRVLHYYTKELLDLLIGITATSTLLAYSLYTMSQPTLFTMQNTATHKSLIYTLPVVIYGVFRYLYLLYRVNEQPISADIALQIFYDKQLLAILILWLSLTVFLLADI